MVHRIELLFGHRAASGEFSQGLAVHRVRKDLHTHTGEPGGAVCGAPRSEPLSHEKSSQISRRA